MKRRCICWLVLAAILNSGCVERRFVILSDPPGAIVYDAKGQPIGATPCDKQFTYYGDHKFTLVRDGYQTLVDVKQIRAPWYEIPPLDFISENLIPYRFRDIRRLEFRMQPMQVIPPEEVLNEAGPARQRGLAIQPPEGQAPTFPVAPQQGVVVPTPMPQTGPMPNAVPSPPTNPPPPNVFPQTNNTPR